MKAIQRLTNQRTLARYESREFYRPFRMPRTDYAFREPTDNSTVAAPPEDTRRSRELRSFRQMSQDPLAKEDRRNYVIEMVVLGLIIALVAWPLISLLIVLAQTAGG